MRADAEVTQGKLALPACRCDSVDHGTHIGAIKLAGFAHAGGQIIGPDEDRIDAFHANDCVNIIDRVDMLDLQR